jgi:hypothetical protein
MPGDRAIEGREERETTGAGGDVETQDTAIDARTFDDPSALPDPDDGARRRK